MSADNMICIQKRLDGKWWVWMGFVSEDEHKPKPTDHSFDAKELASAYAHGWADGEMWLEYGVVHLPQEKSYRVDDILSLLKVTVETMDIMEVTNDGIEMMRSLLDELSQLCIKPMSDTETETETVPEFVECPQCAEKS